MKKITFLILTILPLIGIGQNYVNNPTFVDATSWTDANAGTGQGLVAPADSHSADGSTSYKIVSNGTFNSQVQNTAVAGLTAGEYLFEYWVKGTAGVNTMPQIRDNGSNVNGTNYTILSTGVWEYVAQTFTVSGAGTVSVRLFIKNNVAGTAIQVDDVSFTYIPPAGNTLTTNVIGSGKITKNPDKISYDPSDVVQLTANANSHWNFDSWSGDLIGSTNPSNITMDADKTVTANFTIDPTFDYAFTFDTDNDLEGWDTTDANVSLSGPTSGLVTVGVTADQWARINLYGFPIPSASYNKVTITLDNQTTNDELGFVVNGEALAQQMTSGIQTYNFDLTQYANWIGDPDSFRIRIADAENTTSKPLESGDIVIDDIVFSYDPNLGSNDFDVSSFSIYPNPTKNILNINSKTEISKVRVYDITGKQVLETARLYNNQLNVSSLKTGLYLLRIEDVNKNTVVKKLVIQ